MSGIRRHWIELAAICFGAASILAALFWRWQPDRVQFVDIDENGQRVPSDPWTTYEGFLAADRGLSDIWFLVMCASLVVMLAGFLIPRSGSRRDLRTKVLAASGMTMAAQGCLLAFLALSPFLLVTGLLTMLEPLEIITPTTQPEATGSAASRPGTDPGDH